MGLFTPNYNKPGKGIEKDAPQKRRIWQFFEIIREQYSKLILANILYSLFMLPLMVGIMLCFGIDFSAPSIIVFKNNMIDLVGLICLIISIFVSFPATLGFTYILRNVQRWQHAWIWHDFIKHTKKSYWQGVVNGVVTLLCYFFFIFAYGAYRSGIINLGIYNYPLSIVMLLCILVFTWMQFYVNTMIVTFDLKMKQVYQNAFIFAIAKLPLNILISLICIVLFYLLLLIPIPFITFFLTFIIWYSLFGFIVVFGVYPSIDKHMLSKVEQTPVENEEIEEQL